MNSPVSFELAKLLKEKGFEQKDCKGYYLKNGLLTTMPFSDYTNGFTVAAAPTITDAVMWLYEKHGLWIKNEMKYGSSFYCFSYQIQNKKRGNLHEASEFNSPEKSYEAAILYCLNNFL